MRYLLLSLVTRFLGLVPVRWLELLSHPLGRLTWALSKTKRNSTLVNLAACFPELAAGEAERLGRASMRHYVMTALETGICWYWPMARINRHFDEAAGLEHLARAREQGPGVLVLMPHHGNWELLSHWLQQHAGLIALYKPGRYPALEQKLLAKRIRFGQEMTPTTRAGLRVLYQRLRAGRLALVLPDQDPSEGSGRFAPFFGLSALTGTLASRLAQQTGCPAVLAVCVRSKGGRFRTHILPVEEEFHSRDPDVSLAALNRGVERCVAIERAQYLWAYKRFKSRPEGEPPFY